MLNIVSAITAIQYLSAVVGTIIYWNIVEKSVKHL
jgi:hypothetical protein